MVDSENKRLKVIYILSNGRSGSTLLDLLLGAHPNIWTLGEAHMLPWEVRWEGPCGCGKPHRRCEFWREILDQIPLEPGASGWRLEHFRGGKNGGGKVLRPALLPDFLLGRVAGPWADAARAYGEANLRYFTAVQAAAQGWRGEDRPVRYLVDASKDPYRLLWLHSSGLLDLRVIHLFKDPRAFVYSMTKGLLPDADRKVARYTGRWVFENALFTLLGKRSFPGDRMVHLRYEELARDPDGTLQELGRWLGLAMPGDLSHTFRTAETHGVSGNKMRWENTTVKLDQKWRRRLPARYARAIALSTAPVRAALDRVNGQDRP